MKNVKAKSHNECSHVVYLCLRLLKSYLTVDQTSLSCFRVNTRVLTNPLYKEGQSILKLIPLNLN